MFDLYIFDLDGTLINTESLHYESYKQALKFFNYNKSFTFNDYCKYAHYDNLSMKSFVENKLNMTYEKFYQKKKEIYLGKLDTNLQLIEGVEQLLLKLTNNKIPLCIVTHSDRETINKILDKLPILKLINTIITKNDYILQKPYSECYIKALSLFPNAKNPIGFEDSLKGWNSLSNTFITPVFVGNPTYYYWDKINPINYINNFSNFESKKILLQSNDINNWIESKLDIYKNKLATLSKPFGNVITKLIPLIKNTNNNIYLTGIGKCGHVTRKCISTWQSMGISAHFLNLTELFHGDFGILKPNDIIIYISNSGNTVEILNCAKYIRQKFKVCQIALTLNKNCELINYVDLFFNIASDVQEIDNINMAPTMSSVIFMMFLDMLGVYLAEKNNITIEKFQLYHPGGHLGKKSKNIIDTVIIIASGEGSRLYPLTKYIPKLLVTFNNKPFIESLIEYWQKYTQKIVIVHNEQYTDLIQFYVSQYNNIRLIQFNNITGTADTIAKTITNEYYNNNILFTWCDILPNEDIDINKLKHTTIFTYGNECRYKAIDNNIIKAIDGNIIGMFYIRDYNSLNYAIGDDICDIFTDNFTTFDIYNMDNLIDIGDINKLSKYNNNINQTRFFNKIELYENYIIKSPNNKQGEVLIKKEMNWYQTIANLNYDFIPKFEPLDGKFKLELINGEPLYKTFNNYDIYKKQNILNKIYNYLDILHQKTIQVKSDVVIQDILLEACDKINDRLNKIQPILNKFNYISRVNGVEVKDLSYILNYLKNILLQDIETSYNFIHGDLNFSNILYDEDKDKIFFIDPRGYFGMSVNYGLKAYDYAKILYALTGYDIFNNDNMFSFEIVNNEIIFNIQESIEGLIIKLDNKIKAWLVIIWFGLAQYNSNNVLKCVASYYNGFYWFNKFFN